MEEIVVISILFIIATITHGSFLVSAKNVKDDKSRLLFWYFHNWINGMLWLTLIITIIFLQFRIGDFKQNFIILVIGAILCITGSVLIIYSFSKLGFKKAMGYRFFVHNKLEWISEGAYSFLQNPMYEGFVLVLVGLGLIRGIMADFYIAAESFLFLNLFLASIENRR